MTLLYGRWGLVANLALLVNVALTFAALSLLGATLTLPGIAGIVLGIGLAVDANVLINERIREETRNGKGAAAALDAGFRRAYATIVDSNLTALIATALLFWFGSGPVRGFAVTMALGIMISMFTAVSVVQAIMASWLAWRRPKQFLIEPLIRLRLWQGTPNFRYMRARFLGIAVSIVLSLASIGLFVKPGLNYGIDFIGGILIEAKAPRAADLATLRTELAGLGLGEITLQEFGDASTVLVRIGRQPGDDAAQLAAVDRAKAAIEQVEPGTSFARLEVVGPKISRELAQTGIIAVVLASLAMLFYIWFRFEWPFAVGAIATLVLDVTKVVGLHGADRHRLQPHRHRRTAHARRLFGERQGRGLRPHAREHATLQGHVAARHHRQEHQRNARAQSLHLGHRVSRDAADGDLGRCRGRKLRAADDLRNCGRGEFVDLHRGADPAVPGGLADAAARACESRYFSRV